MVMPILLQTVIDIVTPPGEYEGVILHRGGATWLIISAQSFIAHLSVPKRWFEAIALIVVTTGIKKL